MPSKLLRAKTVAVAGLAMLSIGGMAAAATGLASGRRHAGVIPRVWRPGRPRARRCGQDPLAERRGHHQRLGPRHAERPRRRSGCVRGRQARLVPGLERRAGRRPRQASRCAGVPGIGDRSRRRRPDRRLLRGRARRRGHPWTAAGHASRRPAGEDLTHHRTARGSWPGERPGWAADDHLTPCSCSHSEPEFVLPARTSALGMGGGPRIRLA
jgi:hypothetical protein